MCSSWLPACSQPLQLFDHLEGLKNPVNRVKQLYSRSLISFRSHGRYATVCWRETSAVFLFELYFAMLHFWTCSAASALPSAGTPTTTSSSFRCECTSDTTTGTGTSNGAGTSSSTHSEWEGRQRVTCSRSLWSDFRSTRRSTWHWSSHTTWDNFFCSGRCRQCWTSLQLLDRYDAIAELPHREAKLHVPRPSRLESRRQNSNGYDRHLDRGPKCWAKRLPTRQCYNREPRSVHKQLGCCPWNQCHLLHSVL